MFFKMLKKIFSTALISIVFLLTEAAAAKEGTYTGFGLSRLSFYSDTSAGIYSENFTAMEGRLGNYLNETFSSEMRLGLGITNGEAADLKNYFGGYLRAGTSVSDNFYPYAIVGFSVSKVDISFGPTTSRSDFSYGLGADISINSEVDLTIEYLSLYDNSEGDLDSINIGFKFVY